MAREPRKQQQQRSTVAIVDYKGVLERATALAKDYSRVYALIDVDKVIQDGQQVQYHV
jgi:hypothetical protein